MRMSKSGVVIRPGVSRSLGLPRGVLPRRGHGTGLRAHRERKWAAAAEGRK